MKAVLLLAALLLSHCKDVGSFTGCARNAILSSRTREVRRAIATRNRHTGDCILMAAEAEKGGPFGGFFANVFGGPEESNPNKDRVVKAVSVTNWFETHDAYIDFNSQLCPSGAHSISQITAPGGWDLSLEIGSQIAKQLGGSGEVFVGWHREGVLQSVSALVCSYPSRACPGLRLSIALTRAANTATPRQSSSYVLYIAVLTFLNMQLAKGDVMTVNIDVGVRLTLDEGYDPPQGMPVM